LEECAVCERSNKLFSLVRDKEIFQWIKGLSYFNHKCTEVDIEGCWSIKFTKAKNTLKKGSTFPHRQKLYWLIK
jgi:hypothetical protein